MVVSFLAVNQAINLIMLEKINIAIQHTLKMSSSFGVIRGYLGVILGIAK